MVLWNPFGIIKRERGRGGMGFTSSCIINVLDSFQLDPLNMRAETGTNGADSDPPLISLYAESPSISRSA